MKILKINSLLLTGLVMILMCGCTDTTKTGDTGSNTVTGVKDATGNSYATVTIGTQVWFAENLKTTKFNDGSVIPNITDNKVWSALTSSAYAWFDNGNPANDSYGPFYNWYAVNSGKLCPTGWHVPSDTEWIKLTAFLGGDVTVGGKLKSTTGWNSYNGVSGNGTNTVGFNGLPAGYRLDDGTFNGRMTQSTWWTSTPSGSALAWHHYLLFSHQLDNKGMSQNQYGRSVRCLKD